MSDLEFNIQISGSNNDSNLVLKSESATINDTHGEASSGNSEKVSALEKKLKLLDDLEEIKFKYDIPYIPDSLLPKNDEQVLELNFRKLPEGEVYSDENIKFNVNTQKIFRQEVGVKKEHFFYNSSKTRAIWFVLWDRPEQFIYSYLNFYTLQAQTRSLETLDEATWNVLDNPPNVAISYKKNLDNLKSYLNDHSKLTSFSELGPADQFSFRNIGITQEVFDNESFVFDTIAEKILESSFPYKPREFAEL